MPNPFQSATRPIGNANIKISRAQLRSTSVPPEFQGHPLVQRQFFLTIPRPLLDALAPILPIDSALLEMERALSQICGDHTTMVGFHNTTPIEYSHMRLCGVDRIAVKGADLNAKRFGIDPREFRNILEIAEQRFSLFATTAKGYAGWLMLLPDFVKQQNELLAKWESAIRIWGLPRLPRASFGPIPPPFERISDKDFLEYSKAFDEFFLHWRLASLAAPNLPNPLMPQTPMPAPIFAIGPQSNVGALCYLPDTFSVPSRDELRDVLEDSLRGDGGPNHLKEWTSIVRGDNSAKNQIERYSRLFELQHYWRLLTERHTEAIKGNMSKLELAFAQFLKCSDATIHKDLAFIRQRIAPRAS